MTRSYNLKGKIRLLLIRKEVGIVNHHSQLSDKYEEETYNIANTSCVSYHKQEKITMLHTTHQHLECSGPKKVCVRIFCFGNVALIPYSFIQVMPEFNGILENVWVVKNNAVIDYKQLINVSQ